MSSRRRIPTGDAKENGPSRKLAKAHRQTRPNLERIAALLYAERTATAAGALDVWVVELEAGAFQRLDIVDGNAFQIHFAHLIDEDLESVEFIDVVGWIFRILKRHVIAEARAASAHDGHAERSRRGDLLAHCFF